jgi:hypothetical protein
MRQLTIAAIKQVLKENKGEEQPTVQAPLQAKLSHLQSTEDLHSD